MNGWNSSYMTDRHRQTSYGTYTITHNHTIFPMLGVDNNTAELCFHSRSKYSVAHTNSPTDIVQIYFLISYEGR